MSADTLLSRLEGVKRTGNGRWIARSPCREDKHPSMTIRELDDGRVLLHDFGGDSVEEILAAVNMTFADLFPPREIQHGKPERRPFPASDVLRCIAFEALVVAAAGAAMLAGEPLSAVDRDRLILAVARIEAGLDAGGLRHA